MWGFWVRIWVGGEEGEGDDTISLRDMGESLDAEDEPLRRWVGAPDMGDVTLSTGMRRCWEVRGGGEERVGKLGLGLG